MEIPDDYEFEWFEKFFRDRLGWHPVDSIAEPYLREFVYRSTFADRARLDRRGMFESFHLFELSAEPAKYVDEPQVVTFRLPFADLANGPGESHVEIDLSSADAENEVIELERQAREVRAADLLLAILYGSAVADR